MTKPQSTTSVKILFVTILIVSYLFSLGVQEAYAGTKYTLLQRIPLSPGSTDTRETTAATYLKGLFNLTIAIAGVLAVIKIIFGGIQYMSTDAFGAKSEAKTTIQHAIWGLALALSAWLILHTINPALIQFNFNLPSPVQKTNNTPS